MNQATVSIAAVYPPGPGKTNWGLMGGDQMRYSVPPEFGNQLQTGQSVSLDYEIKNFQGKDVRMVKKVSFMSPVSRDPRPEPPPVRDTYITPGASTGTPQRHSQSKEMAVMGIVGRAMGSGQFSVGDIKLLMAAAAQGWDEVIG